MRILFAGTPDIAVPALETLASRHEVAGVLTNPDRPKGRGKKKQHSPVKEKALALELPLFQPEKLDAGFCEILKKTGAELLVCFAYGRIFSPAFLELFPRGGINFHPSRLPELRGPSPLSALILKGETKSAVTVQTLAEKMDAGDILLQEEFILGEDETLESLGGKAARMAGPCLLKVLEKMEAGTLLPKAQDHDKATYCRLVGKQDGRLDWNLSALQLDRVVRACYPWPLGHTFWRGRRLNILESRPFFRGNPAGDDHRAIPGKVLALDRKEGFLIQTGHGVLAVTRLQLQSKKALDFKSFYNGSKDFTGSVLGENHESEE